MSLNSLNICFISNTSGKSGGAERTLPQFVNMIRSKGVGVYVILPSRGPMIDDLEKLGIKYAVLPYRMWMHQHVSLFKKIIILLLNSIMLFPICFKIFQWKCDVVFSNTVTVPVGAFAAFLARRKHIWYIREFGEEDHGRYFDLGRRVSFWLIKNLSDKCIFNSFAVEEKYKQFLPMHKLKVVYEGYIIPNQEEGHHEIPHEFNNKASVNCLMIGTLQDGKGHVEAIKAISELKKENINAALHVLGSGFDKAYENMLHSLVSENNLENNVFFYGHIDNPFPFIENCDIFLMCSRKEAFGIVTTEAMQFGKPVIGASSGGTKELVIEQYNGLLYAPGNYIELANKIKYLINNPDISNKFGSNGKKMAYEKFTFNRYVNEMLEIIKAV